MQKLLLTLLAAATMLGMQAAEPDTTGYRFTTIRENPVTPVKNQNRSSTCWAFSGLGFLESEMLRMGRPETDLSEMFIVHHCYTDKADKYVRMHGALNFAPGGSFEDVFYVFEKYGAVPEEIMPGLNYGESKHVHNEMDAVLKGYADALLDQKKLTTAWKKGFSGILDSYLGNLPEEFTWQGKNWTPKTYAASLGLNPDNYVSLTSYTHHPFYSSFVLEIPDNWQNASSYNIPIDELMELMEKAVMEGYTIAWAADVSEKGFTRNGIGVMPDVDMIENTGSDQARWVGLSQKEKDDELKKLIASPCQEITATQEMRQSAFDNYETTDDHGMQIYGIAHDQNGKKYYMVKNSWGTDNKYKGTWYVSENFVRYKTMSIVLHKDALDKNLKQQLQIL